MSFILIATNRLKSGALAAERERVPELVQFLEQHEPRLIAFNEYADERAEEVTVVQIHPDAESVRLHTEVVAGHAARAYEETLDATVAIELYGAPDDEIVAMLRRQAGAGVRVLIRPHHLGGFTRSR
jgi:hypothetical protein